ncbi:MAG: hypothetical protein LUF00_07135 [Lachnospiraceae bacterium]|nr:hypothetical protein [Lachnospiraceae bacterium]
MDNSTKTLLEECNSGCKMAIQSMDQVREYVRDEKLSRMISSCRQKHAELEQETEKLLHQAGHPEKEPHPVATAFSWLTTEVKMKMKDDSRQVARVMMDGCRMGIKSISEQKNRLEDASHESRSLAEKLLQTEEDFLEELEAFV